MRGEPRLSEIRKREHRDERSAERESERMPFVVFLQPIFKCLSLYTLD